MAIRNNAFSQDTDSIRGERLVLLSKNIDTFAAMLGITGDRLTWAQGASAAWRAAISATITENGESEDAFEDFHDYLEETSQYYAAARVMLENIIKEYGGKTDDFIFRYGFKSPSPRMFPDLCAKIEAWIEYDAELKALIPPDPRVVSDTIITQLTDRLATLKTSYTNAYREKQESENAYNVKHRLFSGDSYQLNIIFVAAKLCWGTDDPRLRLLGFCPKSEIWTHKKPPAPKNFEYDDLSGTFSWDAVEDADLYQLDCRLINKKGDWAHIYEGAESSTTNRPPIAGEYDIRCRAIAGSTSGNWCTPITVDFA